MGLDMYLYAKKNGNIEKLPKEYRAIETIANMEEKDVLNFIKKIGTDKFTDLLVNKDLYVADYDYIQEFLILPMKKIGYWRKANQIHNWFVENVQDEKDDCKYYIVTRNQIKELLKTCEEVIKSLQGSKKKTIKVDNREYDVYVNDTIANELLPTYEGFFFGSYLIDDYYLEDLYDTVMICRKALSYDDTYEFVYSSSW